MRLVHLISALGVGGTEAVLLDLCRHRNRQDFEVTVACVGEPVSVMADEIRATGTPVVTGWEAGRKAVAEADLVNLHWWGYERRMFELLEGKPRVTTLHWRAVLPRIPAVTICTSAYVREIQTDPRRFVAIPNGIDVEQFARPAREPRDEVVITRVCRPPKCSPYFWDVIHRLLARYPQLRVRIVGNDAPAQHPSGRVSFLGIRRDVAQILWESDLFLYTPYPEAGTKDLVVMEASAAGVPCVVSNVSSVRESVQEGRNGFLVRYGDVDAAVRQVAQLVEQPELRAELARSAVQMAREEFDVRVVARKYESVYRGVLAAQ